jgi:hypothetical protein
MIQATAKLIPLALVCAVMAARDASASPRWTEERASAWYARLPWLIGCNFTPSTAINQLEMWQADTFDPATIDRELGWAAQLGFNSVRIYLHHLPWQEDPAAYLQRIEQFLQIADKHGIGAMIVHFDSVWHPFPRPGRQPDPAPHIHNSGWVQCPGLEILTRPERHDEMESYVKGIIAHFANDRRIHAWDLFNEPDNRNDSSYGRHEPANKHDLALNLLKKAYGWARECSPSQPITSGVWHSDWSRPETLAPMLRFQLEESDIITFHSYADLNAMKKAVESLKRYNRPILCTEYMARPVGSTFEALLPYMKEHRIGAYNWGLVAGRTQTQYPWDSWRKTYTAEPPLWFHEILRPDGTPYRQAEVNLIRRLTGKAD